MKKLFIGLFLCVFVLSGFGLFRLNELNKIPINVENFSTYNLVEIYVLGIVMSVLAYPIYPEMAIEHLALYSKTKKDRTSDFFLKSEVVSKAIKNYTSPKRLVWNIKAYKLGHKEARVALALNGSTLFKQGKEISIKVPIEYPKETLAKLAPGIEVQEGLFWVLQQKGWYHTGTMTWKYKLENSQ